MKNKIVYSIVISIVLFCCFGFDIKNNINHIYNENRNDSILVDSLRIDSLGKMYKLFKNPAHATYYHDKFNGRRTASGKIFNNNEYTAAHKKLKFGTKVLVTNEKTNKSVVVTITDRGPFVKGRDIDLSKKAFMEIAGKRWGSTLPVKLEILQEVE